MKETKIQLSAEELLLMGNSELILTKNRIIEKVCLQFGLLAEMMQEEMARRKPLPGGAGPGPKISRGEKYQGLPYVMLDYPRIFEKEHVLAIRTFFWWGHFCSITLHLKGRFRATALSNIMAEMSRLRELQVYVSVSGDEWNHDIHSSDYEALSLSGARVPEDALEWAGFIKVAVKIEFSRWNEMPDSMFSMFLVLVKLAGV